MAAWETLIAEYRVAAPAPLTLRPLEPVKYADTADGAALENDWRAMTDVHQFFGLLRKYQLSRQQAYRIIRSAGEEAGTATHTHPHMLRHACGYELAERGTDTRLIQDYLGHRNIRHTVRYTASNAARFAGLWERNNLLEENSHGTKK